VELDGETLIDRAVRVARQADLQPIVVVLQDASLRERLQAAGVDVLLNCNWFEGMATSIVAGVLWAQGKAVSGVVLMTCDQVLLRAEHLRLLVAEPEQVMGSRYAGRSGIPAYFPASSFADLLQLKGDTGARELLRDSAAIEAEELAVDIDTEMDLMFVTERLETKGM
jgi:CTP:molybdopterin cytidylyltransferase MocA